MAILSIARDWGVEPSLVRISASNTLAEVGTAGYLTAQADNIAALNAGAFDWLLSDMVLVYASDGWGFFTISSDFASLSAFAMSGNVSGPTVIGDFAVFADITGTIEDLGYLPSDATKTRVVMAGSAVQVGYLAKYADVNGTIDDTAGAAINAGTIQSGLSGTVGGFIAYPATAARGSFRFIAVNNTGDTITTLSNVAMGQASVISIPDPADALGRLLIGATATPFTSGNFPVASGTGGLMVDSGLAAANIQNKTNIKAATTANIGGAGAGPLSVVVAGATAASVVVASVESSSNPASVIACTATATGFDVTLSADPGASCLLNYVLFIAAQ